MATSIKPIDPCLVCGEKSIGFNFGVRTCMACKAFFRRNAVKLGTYNFLCPKDGDCPITNTHRRLCNCCRLAKCFRVGMKKELILSEDEKLARRENRNNKRLIGKIKSKRSMQIAPVIELKSIYLSNLDDIILQNIFNVYESSCKRCNYCRNETFPVIKHSNIVTYLNEYSSSHKVLIEFLKQLPEFTELTIYDRICLLRNNFGFINNINSAVLFPGITTNLIVSLRNVFGSDLSCRLIESIERIQMFTFDHILLKLLLIIITFSSGSLRNESYGEVSEISSNSLAIFATQCTYVELLWKYILTKSSDEVEGVKFFNKLIQFLMYLLDLHLHLDHFINNLPNEVEQMEPLMKSMWPKSGQK